MLRLPDHPLPWLAAFAFAAMVSPTRLCADPATAPADAKESAPVIRLVFLTSLMENDALVLASPGKEDKWTEHGELKARPSSITEWFGVRTGELHLARRTPEGLASKGRLLMPAGSRSAVAIILADPKGQTYLTKVIDPSKIGFARGSTLLMNLSGKKAMVLLGKTRVTVEPGATAVGKASLEANGMYRMLLGYHDPERGFVASYDRYVAGNAAARGYLFIIPDENVGLRVLNLPEFGDAD